MHNAVRFAVGCALFEQDAGRFPGPEDVERVKALSISHAASSGFNEGQVAAALPEDLLSDFSDSSEELPAVNAVIGGILANEALKAVSHHGAPINNVFLYSLHDGLGEVETMQ